ncbi:hypothetical protein HYY70_04970 [Candidatus Woesearchaeota archaeon]|nr:hypothetical protein [Candidatus Woesearchaeota archaeon]
MIALKREIFELVKREGLYILFLLALAMVAFKLAFFKESLLVVARVVSSLFWLFVVPGYFVMLYWREKLDFVERIFVGIAITAAATGVFSYYIGLIGLNIKYHTFAFPLILILAGAIANLKS